MHLTGMHHSMKEYSDAVLGSTCFSSPLEVRFPGSCRSRTVYSRDERSKDSETRGPVISLFSCLITLAQCSISLSCYFATSVNLHNNNPNGLLPIRSHGPVEYKRLTQPWGRTSTTVLRRQNNPPPAHRHMRTLIHPWAFHSGRYDVHCGVGDFLGASYCIISHNAYPHI